MKSTWTAIHGIPPVQKCRWPCHLSFQPRGSDAVIEAPTLLQCGRPRTNLKNDMEQCSSYQAFNGIFKVWDVYIRLKRPRRRPRRTPRNLASGGCWRCAPAPRGPWNPGWRCCKAQCCGRWYLGQFWGTTKMGQEMSGKNCTYRTVVCRTWNNLVILYLSNGFFYI